MKGTNHFPPADTDLGHLWLNAAVLQRFYRLIEGLDANSRNADSGFGVPIQH